MLGLPAYKYYNPLSDALHSEKLLASPRDQEIDRTEINSLFRYGYRSQLFTKRGLNNIWIIHFNFQYDGWPVSDYCVRNNSCLFHRIHYLGMLEMDMIHRTS